MCAKGASFGRHRGGSGARLTGAAEGGKGGEAEEEQAEGQGLGDLFAVEGEEEVTRQLVTGRRFRPMRGGITLEERSVLLAWSRDA